MGKPVFDADEAFVITVGVPHASKDMHCRRVLTAIHGAGYRAAPTSDDSIRELAHHIDDQPDPPLEAA